MQLLTENYRAGIAEKRHFCSALADLEAAAATGGLGMSMEDLGLQGDEGFRRILAGGGGGGDPEDWMFESTYFWSTVYRWIGRDCRLPDPGMYAVIGMAAFLGGTGRITMMLACVIVELTDDASLIAPVGVATIVSMIVGNLFNHGLYHMLIPVMNVPFLNEEPSDAMWLVSVTEVMTQGVRCVSKTSERHSLEELLAKCKSGEITHNAFPVVDSVEQGRPKLRGIITLEDLKSAAEAPADPDDYLARRNRAITQERIIKDCCRLLQCDRASLFLIDEETGGLTLHLDKDQAVIRIPRGVGIAGHVATTGEVVNVPEPYLDPRFNKQTDKDTGYLTTSLLCVPVRDDEGEIIAVLQAVNKQGKLPHFTSDDERLIARMSRPAGIALRNAQVFEDSHRVDDHGTDTIHVLDFGDRSPITTVPHAKVARAFDVFRKLGMRHMCVVDSDNLLVGIVTRKDLMTYKVADNVQLHKAEAIMRGYVYRWRLKKRVVQLEAARKVARASGGTVAAVSPSRGLERRARAQTATWTSDSPSVGEGRGRANVDEGVPGQAARSRAATMQARP